MVLLDFELDLVAPQGYLGPHELAVASETHLRYSGCTGKLRFLANEADFSIAGITLLDFAAGLCRVVDKLAGGAQSVVFDFPEGEGNLSFSRVSDFICIRADHTTAIGHVSLSELDAAASDFAMRLLRDAIAAFPGLRDNPSLMKWYPCPK
jgi:hypothetical protein